MTHQPRSFAGSVSLLALGGVLTQAIGIFALPVLGRLFSPAAFGVQTAFLAAVTILASVSTLKYELAIMLPGDDRDAAALLVLNVVILCLFTLAVGGIVTFSGEWILGLPNLGDMKSVLWLVPLGVLLTGGTNALNYWMLREKRFGSITGVRLTGKTTQTVAAIGAGAAGWATGGALVLSRIVENACYAGCYAVFAVRRAREIFRGVSLSRVKTLALRYIQFPLYTSWSGLLNTVSLTLPAFLVVLLFGTTAGGYYGQALALIQVPMFFVGDSIRDVLFPWASSRKASGEDIAPFLDLTARRLVTLITFPAAVVLLIGPEVFTVVLGPEWAEAGVYSRILTPWMFLGFISMPLGVLLYVHERQRALLVYNILLILARCVTLLVAGMLGCGIEAALLLFSLSSALLSGWLAAYALSLYGIPLSRLATHIARALVFCLPALAILVPGKVFLHPAPAVTVIIATLLAIPYIALTVRSDPELGSLAKDAFGRFFPAGNSR